jgi:hypothetical protein
MPVLGAELMFHLGNVVVLTALVAAFVLWRYRVAILGGMGLAEGDRLPVPAGAVSATTAVDVSQTVSTALAWERRARKRITAAYLLAVGLPALALSIFYLRQSGQPWQPAQLAAVTFITLSAAVPMVAVTLATPFWRACRNWLLLLLAGAAVTLLLAVAQRAVQGKAPTLDTFNLLWYFGLLAANQLWLPLLLLLATGNKRLRGVAPITFAGLLVFGLAPLAGSRLTQALADTHTGSEWVLQFGMNAVFVALALPVGWLAWRRLRSLGNGYERKRFSDAQLLAGTWWLMFVAVIGLELMGARPAPLVSLAGCAIAYAMFAPLLDFALARCGMATGRPPVRTLLLLRVFGYTARTERLFDRVAVRWRLFGPVTMIAAPDVIARTVDPAEFLRFVTGRVGDVFVKSQADLDARLAQLDLAPDPDGRFRVSEFCCRDNTWQGTVVALMQRADVVVMDLRGVTTERRGCEFELQQLAARLPLHRVVLVVDGTTKLEVIDSAVPGLRSGLRLMAVERNSIAETDRVFEALLEAANPRAGAGHATRPHAAGQF